MLYSLCENNRNFDKLKQRCPRLLWGLLGPKPSNLAELCYPAQLCIMETTSFWNKEYIHYTLMHTAASQIWDKEDSGFISEKSTRAFFFKKSNGKGDLLAITDYLFLKITRTLKRISIPRLFHSKMRILNNDQYLFILQTWGRSSSINTKLLQATSIDVKLHERGMMASGLKGCEWPKKRLSILFRFIISVIIFHVHWPLCPRTFIPLVEALFSQTRSTYQDLPFCLFPGIVCGVCFNSLFQCYRDCINMTETWPNRNYTRTIIVIQT